MTYKMIFTPEELKTTPLHLCMVVEVGNVSLRHDQQVRAYVKCQSKLAKFTKLHGLGLGLRKISDNP